MSHFSKNKMLTPVQHGFRSNHSCESQLLITTDEFIQNFEGKTQTDVAVLDFSKSFDVVPHQRLLHKLDHYGIRGTTLNLIQKFLTNRTQKVVVDGSSSESNSNSNLFIHVPITSFTSVKVYIYIYIFDDGYKGDPQKALLKAASMRATLRCGA